MSEADKLFEELGYKIKVDDEREIIYQDSANEDLNIVFDKRHIVIGGTPTYDYFLDMYILKEINKKVEELGWN